MVRKLRIGLIHKQIFFPEQPGIFVIGILGTIFLAVNFVIRHRQGPSVDLFLHDVFDKIPVFGDQAGLLPLPKIVMSSPR